MNDKKIAWSVADLAAVAGVSKPTIERELKRQGMEPDKIVGASGKKIFYAEKAAQIARAVNPYYDAESFSAPETDTEPQHNDSSNTSEKTATIDSESVKMPKDLVKTIQAQLAMKDKQIEKLNDQIAQLQQLTTTQAENMSKLINSLNASHALAMDDRKRLAEIETNQVKEPQAEPDREENSVDSAPEPPQNATETASKPPESEKAQQLKHDVVQSKKGFKGLLTRFTRKK